ncbi:tetratricopeptide repeat protein [candidate division KSB1 bacterium]
MPLKRNLVLGFIILLFLFLVAPGVFAQSISKEEFEQAQELYKQKIEEIKRIDEKMQSSPDEYEKLKKDREKLVAEVGQLRESISTYGEMNEKIGDCRSIYREGVRLFRLRNYNDAIIKFDECIQKGEELGTPVLNNVLFQGAYNKGLSYLYLKKYNEAINSYDQSLKYDPDNAGKSKVYYNFGLCYSRLGNNDRAKENFEKAIEFDSEYEKPYYELGTYYFNVKKDFENAYNYAAQAISKDEKYDRAYILAGRALYELAKYDDAINYLMQAIDLDTRKRYYEPDWYLAMSYNQKKEYNTAIEHARRSLTIKNNFGGAILEIGKAYKGLGNEAKALEYFEKLLKDRRWRQNGEYQIDMIKNKDKYIDGDF